MLWIQILYIEFRSGSWILVQFGSVSTTLYKSLTYDDRLVLNELQLPQAGGIDEENVLLPVDTVGLVDVTKHMQP